VALSAAILPTAPAGALVADVTSDASDGSATYDARRAGGSAVTPTQAQRDAVARVLAAAGKGAQVTWDDRFGTPRTMYGGSGYLTGARGGAPVDVARGWVDDNRAAFGMSGADVAAMKVARNHELPGTGTTVVTFAQVFDGVTAVRGGRLTVAVAKDGRVLSYAGDPTRGSAVAGSYAMSPGEALGAVAEDLSGRSDLAPGATGEKAGFTQFAKGPFAGSSYVQKAAFPTADGARAAYRVIFVEKLDEAYEAVVDAESGTTLYRESLVEHESEGTVYENFPGDPGKGGGPLGPGGNGR